MKKFISVIAIIALCLLLTLPALAGNVTNYVVDDADILSDSEEAKLNTTLSQYSEELKCGIYVVTQSEIEGDIESYTDDYYDYNDYGYGDTNTGVMLLLDMSERAWHVTTTGDSIIYDIQPYAEEMGEAFVDGYSSTDSFYEGFISFGTKVKEIIENPDTFNSGYDERESDYYGYDEDYFSPDEDYYFSPDEDYYFSYGNDSVSSTIVIIIAVGVILALITTMIMKSKNKSVRFSANANNYEKPGSFNLRHQHDRFLYHTITRTALPRDTGDHHSSGGGGGGIHVGSSGTSHGGASGHF